MPNFSFLACLEVGEKFGVVWGVGQVATVSYLNPSYAGLVGVELSKVELGLGFDNRCVLCMQVYVTLTAKITKVFWAKTKPQIFPNIII